MPQSALKKISTLRSCGGLLSRLAYKRAKQGGVDVGPLLHRSGLTAHAIKDRDTPVGVRNQIRFVELVADAVGDKILGFQLAYAYDLREIGLLYYVAASAETLWESLLRLRALQCPGERWLHCDRKERKRSSRTVSICRRGAAHRHASDRIRDGFGHPHLSPSDQS